MSMIAGSPEWSGWTPYMTEATVEIPSPTAGVSATVSGELFTAAVSTTGSGNRATMRRWIKGQDGQACRLIVPARQISGPLWDAASDTGGVGGISLDEDGNRRNTVWCDTYEWKNYEVEGATQYGNTIGETINLWIGKFSDGAPGEIIFGPPRIELIGGPSLVAHVHAIGVLRLTQATGLWDVWPTAFNDSISGVEWNGSSGMLEVTTPRVPSTEDRALRPVPHVSMAPTSGGVLMPSGWLALRPLPGAYDPATGKFSIAFCDASGAVVNPADVIGAATGGYVNFEARRI